jgi:hypothetical protein
VIGIWCLWTMSWDHSTLVDLGQICGNDTVPVIPEGCFSRVCCAAPGKTRRKSNRWAVDHYHEWEHAHNVGSKPSCIGVSSFRL